MAKKQKILLQAGADRRYFDAEHAARVLSMKNNGGWHLPEDSTYKLQEDGTFARRNKGGLDKPAES
jgi:hypothetical protein